MIFKTKIAYLSTPHRGIYVINLQVENSEDVLSFEISKGHLSNIIIDGTTLALREVDNRVGTEEPRG